MHSSHHTALVHMFCGGDPTQQVAAKSCRTWVLRIYLSAYPAQQCLNSKPLQFHNISEYMNIMAVPKLKRLVAGFPPQWPRFTSGQHVGFVVDKATLGQVPSEYFGFPCQSFHQFIIYIPSKHNNHYRTYLLLYYMYFKRITLL
jgi:hypothetical protein